jgi:hypothetical protein
VTKESVKMHQTSIVGIYVIVGFQVADISPSLKFLLQVLFAVIQICTSPINAQQSSLRFGWIVAGITQTIWTYVPPNSLCADPHHFEQVSATILLET